MALWPLDPFPYLTIDTHPVILLLIIFISFELAWTLRAVRRSLGCWLGVMGLVGFSTMQAQMTAVVDTTAYRPGGIEGWVVNALTGKNVEGATVRVTGSNSSGVTDAEGRFHLRNLFPGTRALTITADGMRTVWVSDIPVQPGRTVHLRTIDLRPVPLNGVEELEALYVNASQLAGGADDFATSLIPLAQMVVMPSRYEVIEEAVASSSELRKGDFEILPQNSEDLYRAIALLPGLATSDTATRFWVRGAPNDQVLTRYDGVDLLEPFHIKGFDGALSVVDLETISRLDLITGGFTAKYGERMAGVLTMESESFDPAQPRNTLGASLTGARAINRGEFGQGRGSWTIEGRAGYPGAVVGTIERDGQDLKTDYSDFTGKIEYRLAPNQGVSLHFLHSQDQLKFTAPDTPYLQSDYGSDYLWGRWRGKFGERLYGETVLSLAYLSWRHREAGTISNTYDVLLKDNRYLTTEALRQNWTMIFSDRALIQGGFNYSAGSSSYTYHVKRTRLLYNLTTLSYIPNELHRDLRFKVDGESEGVYLAPRLRVTSRLTIEPSVRFDRQTATDDRDVSPRFNASLALGRTTLRGAWGIYYQPQALHQLGVTDNDLVFHPAERAEHRVLSLSHRLVSGIELRAEAYERQLSRLRPHWENLINVDETFPELRFDRRQLLATRGVARGIELVAEDRTPGVFNWAASYVLAASTEKIEGRNFPRARDQRHTFALDLSYSPTPKWRISAAWQYHTGWPTTEVIFFGGTLITGEQVVVATLGPLYAQRLPAYHRLDLRVTRMIYLNKTTLRIYADLFNAYNHKNIQGYDYSPATVDGQIVTTKKAQNQISFTPNLGLVWEF